MGEAHSCCPMVPSPRMCSLNLAGRGHALSQQGELRRVYSPMLETEGISGKVHSRVGVWATGPEAEGPKAEILKG